MALLKRKRAGLNDPMSVVTRFVNACNRHDADAIFACLHPSFDSIQPMFPSRNFRGADQVRRNWQAIFDAEPGFRLTVLRSAAMDDIVWLELHGAGRDAEVAGVFVMGVQGDRIRWARIYSALVEPVPAGTEDASADRHEAPSQAGAGNGEVAEDALIAPVVDIEHSPRRRRRSRSRREGAAAEAPAAPAAPTAAPPEAQPQSDPEPVAEPEAGTPPEPEPEPRPPTETATIAAQPVGDAVATQPEPEPEVLVAPGAEPEAPSAPEPTAAHDRVSELATGEEQIIVVPPEPEPQPEPEP
ncbi:MAG TPA: nuclear transport factor 2 family protein, partial [Acidimicrobiales bacterium]|nr:nuclear transport factor 2 family protein [Acidimicrobiales bacterium]